MLGEKQRQLAAGVVRAPWRAAPRAPGRRRTPCMYSRAPRRRGCQTCATQFTTQSISELRPRSTAPRCSAPRRAAPRRVSRAARTAAARPTPAAEKVIARAWTMTASPHRKTSIADPAEQRGARGAGRTQAEPEQSLSLGAWRSQCAGGARWRTANGNGAVCEQAMKGVGGWAVVALFVSGSGFQAN